MSAQDSIPYQRMYPDGICRVTDTHYTRTICFQDINYQLAQNEDKTAIFDGWCDFLNYFDSSVQFQLTFVNLSTTEENIAQRINIPLRGDDFDNIRAEYTQMLRNQVSKGKNGLTKTKYLTYGIDADNIQTAKSRLDRIENDLLNNFKRLGVTAEGLNGAEYLHVLHDILNIDEKVPFSFSWDWLVPSGLSTKDFIAPSSFEFKTGKQFSMGSKLCAVSFLNVLAPELNDRILADFLDMESNLVVSMHIQSVDQTKAIKDIKRKITDLDKSKIEEQKKAVRAGYDMDIIPSDLATYGAEAKKLLQDLQSRNERMFLFTFIILNTANTQRQLKNNIFQASSIAQKHNCSLVRLDFQQEDGCMSCLPLGQNLVDIRRGMITSSSAIFVPFTTQELYQTGEGTLYYGINALSGNIIMVDRKRQKNPNGIILGTPGSGKSFAAKREMSNVFFVTDDDIIVCDPESEYGALVNRLHGQVIRISPTSTDYINPMDLNLDYSDDENPLSLKSDFILSLCELNADCTACISDDELIFDGRINGNPTVEGPKFYKRGGMYYIMAPAGGVKTGWQLVMKSPSVHGPYEWKVAMHEADLPLAGEVSSEARGPHQGGWVTDARGDEWFVHFEDRYAWGRVTHLQPLTWDSEGWCIIGQDADGDGIGEPVARHRSPAVAKGKRRTVTAVDGTGLEWQWNANPGKASAVAVRNLWDAPALRLKKIEGPAQEYEMGVGELPSKAGERCGVTVFGRSYAAVDILRNEDSTLTLRYIECFNAKKGSAEEVLWESQVPDGCRGISVKVSVRESEAAASHTEKTGADEGMLCSFAFRFDGIQDAGWQVISIRPFPAQAGEWVGAKIGTYRQQ